MIHLFVPASVEYSGRNWMDGSSRILDVNVQEKAVNESPQDIHGPSPGGRSGFQHDPQGPDSRWTPPVWV